MSEHSKLPWRVDKTLKCIITADDKIVLRFSDSTGKEQLGNADLIVQACNAHEDLLKVAQNAEVWIRGLLQGDPEQIHIDHILQELQAAIANATGE